MGFLAKLVAGAFRAQSPENPSTTLGNPSQWLTDWFTGGGPTFAGANVNELNAVRATAVFRCVSIIAGTIASLPWNVYRRTRDGSRELAGDHPVHRLLHEQPNETTSSFTYRQIIAASLLTNGNGYSIIGRTNGGRVLDLLQLPPQAVEVERVGAPGAWRLRYTANVDGKRYPLDQADVIHVPGLGFDGIKGVSVISAVGRQSIGLALALEESAARMAASGARPSGVVTVDKALSPQALENLRGTFRNLYSGVEKTGATVFLDKGMTWSAMQISPHDAELLESRRFQVTDVARVFGVPPWMLGETDKSTSWGTGIESQKIGFVEFVIRPWLVAIEQEYNRKLLRPPYFCEFALEGLLRGDSKTRSEFYSSAINNAWMTPNEVRQRENLPAVEAGGRLYINSASVPLELAGADRKPGGIANVSTSPANEPTDGE